MSGPVRLLGCYKAEISHDARNEALEWKTQSQLDEELADCVLIELALDAPIHPRLLDQISHGEQAPWLDTWLDEVGTAMIEPTPDTGPCRLVFYLHFVTVPSTVQLWNGQTIKIEQIDPMPEWLRELVPYESID